MVFRLRESYFSIVGRGLLLYRSFLGMWGVAIF